MLTYIQQNGTVGKNIPYPSSAHPKATIATGGCGVCSSLMVLLNSTSYSKNLKKWTDEVIACGGRVAGGTDMKAVCDMMKKSYGFTYKRTTDINELKKHIQKGYKAVAHVGQKGYFAWDSKNNQPSGHFICVAGIQQDGTAIVLDPYYYTGKWKATVNGIKRASYFKYNSETHEVTCGFQTIQRDRRGYYYLLIPTKKIDLKYGPDDMFTTIKFGVDLSEHNGKVNFKKMKNDVDFAILRLGWVGNYNSKKGKYNSYLDKTFEYNYKWATKRKIPVGIYVYMYTESIKAAQEGAKWVIKTLNGRKLDIPYVFCDMEDKQISGLSKAVLTDITTAFNTTIEKNGYKGGVYANTNWYTNKLDVKTLKKKYPIWIADYRFPESDYKFIDEYDMWQFAENGQPVAGVDGNVDKNYMYTDLIKKSTKPTPQPTPSPSPEPKPNPTPVKSYFKKYTGKSSSLADALKAVGANNSYDYRKKIAVANGIKNYKGTADQNTKLLNLLKQGKLIKP